jgi:indolepyruvate ferredoxin oxidoreductase
VDELCGQLNSTNLSVAVELANLPDQIRGYGHVKEANVKAAKTREAALREKLRQAPAVTHAEAATV